MMSCQGGQVTVLLGKGKLLSLHWDLVVLLQDSPVECIILGIEYAPLKEGSSSGISHPQPFLHLPVLPLVDILYGMYNLVKFQKLQPHPHLRIRTQV